MNKKLKVVITMLITLGFTTPTFAKDIKVKVNGMVCGFCAQGITKKFKAEPSVENVDVKLSEKTVTLSLKDGKEIDDSKIIDLLKESGYNVEKIER